MSEFASINPAAYQREERSLSILDGLGLSSEGIPTMFFPETTLKLREAPAIARRFVACVLLAGRGEGLDRSVAIDLLNHYETESELTAEEKEFYFSDSAPESTHRFFHWHQESAAVFAWVVGWLSDFPPVSEVIPGNIPTDILGKYDSMTQLQASAKTIDLGKVLDQADLYYRLYHAIRPRFHSEKKSPEGLSYPAIYFRHLALSWVIGWYGREWAELGIKF